MKKSLSRNFSVYMLKTIFSILTPLVMIPYVSRVLGAKGIGEVQYVQSWVSYFSLIAGLGISSYAVREGAKRRDDKEQLGLFSIEIIAISILSTISAYIFLCVFLHFFTSAKIYFSLFMICGLSIGATGLNTEWICTVFEDYDYISKRSILFQVISLILLFVFVKDSSNVLSYAIVLIMPIVAACLFNWFYGVKKIYWKCNLKLFSIKKHIIPILLIFGVGIASTIYTSLDSTMLGYMRGTEAVGIYTVASRLTKSVLSLVNASCVVFLPRLSYYAGKKEEKFYDLSGKVINILLLLAIPCSIGLVVLSKETIILFSGNGFSEAVLPMKILSLNLFFSALDGFLAWQILIPMNREKRLLIATIVGMTIDGILNVCFIPKWGVSGAALATLLAEISVCIVTVISCYDLVQWKSIIKNIIQCILASIPFIGVYRLTLILESSEKLCIIITVICCSVVYLLCLLALHNRTCIFLLKETKLKFIRR